MTEAMPQLKPPPPKGDDHGVELAQVLENFQANRPIAGNHGGVDDRMNEDPRNAGGVSGHQDVPPVRERSPHDFATKPFDGIGLCARRVIRYDHSTWHSQFARAPGNSLGHVTGAGGHDTRA
jgi:hypothetical protein